MDQLAHLFATAKTPVTVGAVLVAVMVLFGTELVKAVAKKVAEWMVKVSSAGLTMLRSRVSAWCARLVAWLGRCLEWRSHPSSTAKLVANGLGRVLTWLRHLDPQGRSVDPEVLELISPEVHQRGLRVVVAAFVNSVMGLIDRAARADMTVLVGVELGLVGVSMLAIGVQEALLGQAFGVAGIVMAALLLAISRFLADRRRPRFLSVSLVLVGPAGLVLSVLTPMDSSSLVGQANTTLMLLGALSALIAGSSALAPRLRLGEAAGLRYASLAVRSCSICTGIFALANVLQAATAATLLLSFSYLVNAAFLFVVSRTTGQTSGDRFPRLSGQETETAA